MARRIYSDELRRNAVTLVRSGVRIRDAAHQLGMPHGTLWDWVHDAKLVIPQEETVNVNRVDESTYRAALDRVADLEREVAVLVQATVYLVRRLRL